MVDKKISELDEKITLVDNDEVTILDSAVSINKNKRSKISTLKTKLNTSGELSNVAYLDQANTFGSSNTFGGAIAIVNNNYFFFRNVDNLSSSGAMIVDLNNNFKLIYNASNLGTDFIFDSYTNEIMRLTSDGKLGIGTDTPTSKLHVVGIPEYTDNADAIANGLTIGAVYRTGDLMKIVH